MTGIIRRTLEWGNRTLDFEVGVVARQADGAVLVRYGDTVVLCTAVINKDAENGKDFLPLLVNYVERIFAVGKIPGGYFRREGKPTEKEVLTSRLIDRALRPTFVEGFYNDVQIICTLLSHDKESNADVVALIGASAALAIAGAPIDKVVAACRVGYVDGALGTNPCIKSLQESSLDLTVACSADSVFMVEAEANELSEDDMLLAIDFARNSCLPVIKAIEDLAKDVGKEKMKVHSVDINDHFSSIEAYAKDKILACYKIVEKQERYAALKVLRNDITSQFTTETLTASTISKIVHKLESTLARNRILNEGIRIDGRSNTDIRQIDAVVNFLPEKCVHGSALFTRGETQAMVVTTLGSALDEQSVETLDFGNIKEHFMLHYNFPPYCVGDIEPLRGTGRREIGHGKLAYKALRHMLPKKEDFPYTIRIVSEITESNGSSSMATVCGASLSLMSTGVPMKHQVAGIAMGLISNKEKYVVLTDIIGDEDCLGDMDFKVAGSANGITALQMDIKIDGITSDIMKVAMEQARVARLYILNKMNDIISKPAILNEYAPQIIEMRIPNHKIADLIGKSGVTIKNICEKSGCKIDIGDSGIVKIYTTTKDGGNIAQEMIGDIMTEILPGTVYTGKIERVMPFGAVVSLPGKRSGMIHVSEICEEHVDDVSSMLNVGDTVTVVALGFDEKRRIKLSIKQVNSENIEIINRKNDSDSSHNAKGRPRRHNAKKDRNNNKNDDDSSTIREQRRPQRDEDIMPSLLDSESFFANLGGGESASDKNENKKGAGFKFWKGNKD